MTPKGRELPNFFGVGREIAVALEDTIGTRGEKDFPLSRFEARRHGGDGNIEQIGGCSDCRDELGGGPRVGLEIDDDELGVREATPSKMSARIARRDRHCPAT